jgi:dUTP pyrophosphatase|tara:strand:- start:1992 stop:2504 length:513 start_codon:yes stop_codon:yes gene_type:complete
MTENFNFWKDKGARPVWIPPTNEETVIKVKKLTSTATIPTKSRKTDAGYDLYSDEDIALYPEDTKLISTGIAFAIPDGYAGLIWDRSGLGTKGIHRHAGVVDSSYRGEVKVALYNARPGHVDFTDNMYFISRGDRIAQILFQKVPHFDMVETEELDDTDRGSSGFGSSGK